jgi:hypothetical protein
MEEVADAEVGLGHHLDGALMERPQRARRPARGEARAHDDRDRIFGHHLSEEIKPVHPGHFQVEDDHVRPDALHLLHRNQRVRGDGDGDPRIARQDGRHRLAHDGRIVDNEHVQGRLWRHR